MNRQHVVVLTGGVDAGGIRRERHQEIDCRAVEVEGILPTGEGLQQFHFTGGKTQQWFEAAEHQQFGAIHIAAAVQHLIHAIDRTTRQGLAIL